MDRFVFCTSGIPGTQSHGMPFGKLTNRKRIGSRVLRRSEVDSKGAIAGLLFVAVTLLMVWPAEQTLANDPRQRPSATPQSPTANEPWFQRGTSVPHEQSRSVDSRNLPAAESRANRQTSPMIGPASSTQRSARPQPVTPRPAATRTLTRGTSGSSDTQGSAGRPLRDAGSWTSTVGALTFVLLLIYVGSRFVRKHVPAAVATLPVEAVEILGKRQIDPRQAIHLIRCGSRVLVVGASPNGLHALSEISDAVEVDYLAGLCRPVQSTSGSVAQTFRDLFSQQSKARENDEPEPSHSQTAADIITESPAIASLRDRLQNERGHALRPHVANEREQVGA